MSRCSICDHSTDFDGPRRMTWVSPHEVVCKICLDSIRDSLSEFEVPESIDYYASDRAEKPVQADLEGTPVPPYPPPKAPATDDPNRNPCGDNECGRFCECEGVA